MNNDTLTVVFAFLGTAVGTLGGIIASAKLTNYRLEQLEKRVDKHNSFGEKIPILEEKIKVINHRIEDIINRINELEEKHEH